jgi:hypothetical protein
MEYCLFINLQTRKESRLNNAMAYISGFRTHNSASIKMPACKPHYRLTHVITAPCPAVRYPPVIKPTPILRMNIEVCCILKVANDIIRVRRVVGDLMIRAVELNGGGGGHFN